MGSNNINSNNFNGYSGLDLGLGNNSATNSNSNGQFINNS